MQGKLTRIEWIDALKGFAIFYVTLGHLGCNILLEKHIYSFHMFLFFFLSGYVDKSEDISFKEYLLKRTKRILIPFIAWNLMSNMVSLSLGNKLINVIQTTFLLNGEMCWNAPIWYLLTIFITQILYFLLSKVFKIKNIIIISVSLLLWFVLPQKNIILKLNLIPMVMSFFVMGVEYKNKIENIVKQYFVNKHVILKYSLLVIFALVNIYFGVFNNVRIVYTKAVFGNILYTLIGALSGIAVYLILFQRFDFLGKSKILNFLGRNSLIIMATQFYFFIFYDLLANFQIHLYRNTVKAFVMCVATIAFICLIDKILIYIGKRCKAIEKVLSWFGI